MASLMVSMSRIIDPSRACSGCATSDPCRRSGKPACLLEECLQHAEACELDRPVVLGGLYQHVHCVLPRWGVVHLLRQAGDVFAGILQGGQFTASGENVGLENASTMADELKSATERRFKRPVAD